MSDVIKTFVDYGQKTSTKPSASPTSKGVSNLPQRTTGGDGVPEVLYDHNQASKKKE